MRETVAPLNRGQRAKDSAPSRAKHRVSFLKAKHRRPSLVMPPLRAKRTASLLKAEHRRPSLIIRNGLARQKASLTRTHSCSPRKDDLTFHHEKSPTISTSLREFHTFEQHRPNKTCSTLPLWPSCDRTELDRGSRLLEMTELDPPEFTSDELCHLALEIFVRAGLPDKLSGDLGRVKRFILAVRKYMYGNHYHNWYHVFDVTRTLFVLSRRTGVLARLSAWERSGGLTFVF